MTESEWLRSTNPCQLLREVCPQHVLRGEDDSLPRKELLFTFAACRHWRFQLRKEWAAQIAENERVFEETGRGLTRSEQDALDFDIDMARDDSRTREAREHYSFLRVVAFGVWDFDPGETVDYFLLSALSDYARDIFANPFRPVAFSPSWRTSTAVTLASQMYESRDFSAMPILADALQDAGCDSNEVLNHCRDPKQVHVRGCWVTDLVLDKI